MEYSREKTPGNLMQDEYGKIMFKLPNLVNGDYQIRIQGTDLGRVWVDCEESVSFEDGTAPAPAEEGTEPETLAETTAETEAAAAQDGGGEEAAAQG